MKKYFPSAKSKTLGIIIWGILLLVFVLTFYVIYKNSSLSSLIISSIIFLITFLFVGTVWFGTGYFISEDYLIIKIGPVTHSRIMISSIRSLSRSNSILSSPANSLKRLSIKYDQKREVLISPNNEVDFISAITNENPKISVNI